MNRERLLRNLKVGFRIAVAAEIAVVAAEGVMLASQITKPEISVRVEPGQRYLSVSGRTTRPLGDNEQTFGGETVISPRYQEIEVWREIMGEDGKKRLDLGKWDNLTGFDTNDAVDR